MLLGTRAKESVGEPFIHITPSGANAIMEANGLSKEEVINLLWNALVSLDDDSVDLSDDINAILENIGSPS